MNLLNNMNRMMNEGYRLTDASCSVCTGVTLYKQGLNQLYCPKCDKLYPYQAVQADPEEES